MIAGKIAMMLNKSFIKGFTNINYDKVIFITGSNGKTTATNLIYHIIKQSTNSVATNVEGANMIRRSCNHIN